jgi:hypothetical protein
MNKPIHECRHYKLMRSNKNHLGWSLHQFIIAKLPQFWEPNTYLCQLQAYALIGHQCALLICKHYLYLFVREKLGGLENKNLPQHMAVQFRKLQKFKGP